MFIPARGIRFCYLFTPPVQDLQCAFEGDDQELYILLRLLTNVASEFGHVGGIQRSVHLIENEEGSWVIRVYSEEQGQGGHRFLTTGKLFHLGEALAGRHDVVLDTGEIRFLSISTIDVSRPVAKADLCVLQTQKSDTTGRKRLALGQILVDLVDALCHVSVGLVEEVASERF